MPTVYPADLLGLDADPEVPPELASPAGLTERDPFGMRAQVAMGSDNPYFDFRRPGDPGGVGYYRLQSQYVLFDGPSAGVSVGLQAFCPAGLECDGLAEGPTVFRPHLAACYALDDDTAIHAFVGKSVRARAGWSDGFGRGVHYGLAFQSPFPGVEPAYRVNLLLEALGRYRLDQADQRAAPNFEFMPGLQWRLSENSWLAGGVLLPVGPSRGDGRLFQLTCSWQF